MEFGYFSISLNRHSLVQHVSQFLCASASPTATQSRMFLGHACRASAKDWGNPCFFVPGIIPHFVIGVDMVGVTIAKIKRS